MGAAVLPFVPRRAPSRWQVDEIAECYRVIDILHGVGMAVSMEVGVSDEGDPWLVFVREDSQDVIFHIARMGGPLVAATAASDTLFHGRNMRDLLQRILQAQPFVLPASRPLGSDDRLLMHPATMLVAVIATAFLAAQDPAALAGGEDSAAAPEGSQAAEAASLSRKPLDPNGSPGRSAPAADHHATSAIAVTSAVLAAVTVIAGEQILRTADLSQDETLHFSAMGAEAARHALGQPASPVIGIEAEAAPLYQQAAAGSLGLDDSRNAAFAAAHEPSTAGLAELQALSIKSDARDAAPAVTLAMPQALKAGFDLDAVIIRGREFVFGADGLPGSEFAVKAPALAERGLDVSFYLPGVPEEGVDKPVAAAPPSASVSLAGILAQSAMGTNGSHHAATTIQDLPASTIDSRSTTAKMSLSVADLFWYGASIMRMAGIDPCITGRTNATVTELADTKSFTDKSMAALPLDGQGLVITHPGPKVSADALWSDSIASPVASNTASDTATTNVSQSDTALPDTLPLDSAAGAAEPTGPRSGMELSPSEIVQTALSIVNFVYDPRHEIVLQGQDLQILQVLVKNNPAIASADRVLLSHGQILCGDGVMLMPGVALLPAEIFTPKIASDLPTVSKGALEVFFSHDLTVTLAGVIDI